MDMFGKIGLGSLNHLSTSKFILKKFWDTYYWQLVFIYQTHTQIRKSRE
jgi:hypothetical protein